MTLVLIGKDLVLEGSTTKIEDIHRLQVYILICPGSKLPLFQYNRDGHQPNSRGL